MVKRRKPMDTLKIGAFIAERRKAQNLTQLQLAEKLGITDRAVSKWENGKAMPDSSIMLELCKALKISVNDLLSGEIVTMNQNEKQEQILLEIVKEKEKTDKNLLKLEIFLASIVAIVLFTLIAVASFVPMESWIRIVLISLGFAIFLVGAFVALKIEQVVGYYECGKCGHKHVPTYLAVTIAPHVNRTRYMKCPNCKKYSWNKKVLKKD